MLGNKKQQSTSYHTGKKLGDNTVDDALLAQALKFVRPLYEKEGADDKAAKGSDLAKLVKAKIGNKFPSKKQKAVL